MPGTPTVLHPGVSGLPLSGSDYNDNWYLIEQSFLDQGPFVISGLVPSGVPGNLAVSVTAGVAVIGAHQAISTFQIGPLAPNSTNYLYLQENGQGTSNTTGTAPASSVLLGTAVTGPASVTSVNTGRNSGRQQFQQPQNLVPGGPAAGITSAGHPASVNLANWNAAAGEGVAVYGILPGAAMAMDTVLTDPTTSARNVIQPTLDTVRGLAVQRHSATQSANLVDCLDELGTPLVSVDSSGRLIVIPVTETSTASSLDGLKVDYVLLPSGNNSGFLTGQRLNIDATGAVNYTSQLSASFAQARHMGTGTITNLVGAELDANNVGGGTVTTQRAALLQTVIKTIASTTTTGICADCQLVNSIAGGAMTTGIGLRAQSPSISAGAAITTVHGIQIQNQGHSLAPTAYGLRLLAQSGSPTTWSIVSEGGASLLMAGAAATVPLTIQAAGSQTGNLFQLQDSAAGLLVDWTAGGNLELRRLSSTTEGRKVGGLTGGFNSNTDASYTGRLSLIATDFAGDRTVLTGEGDGTNPRIGFLGAAAVAQAANTADLRTALINLGFVASGGANPLNLNGGLLTAQVLLKAGAAGAGNAPLKFQTGTLMTSPEAGACEFATPSLYVTPVSTRRGVVAVSDAVTADVTVANTLTETLVFTGTVAANELTTKSVLDVTVSGYFSTANGTDTVTVRVKVNAVTFITVTSTAGAVSNTGWHLRFSATCRSTGGTGTMVSYAAGSLPGLKEQPDTTVHTVDTTGALNVTVTVQWSNNLAGNTLTLRQGYLKLLMG